MKTNSGVEIVYKKIGETPLEAINRFRLENKNENPELDFLPITYAGRLDPMAEGLLILLVGERAKEKEKYLDLPKTYEFEILWGFETDSLDLLGKITNHKSQITKKDIPEIENVKNYIEKTKGRFEQMYPAFSSRPVNGKPLFEWAREGKVSEIDIPKHTVEVFSVDYEGRKEITKEVLLRYIVVKIDSVKGDFRQEEIKKGWQEALENSKQDIYIIDQIKLEVSSGFYVRQFAYDLGRSLGVPVVAFGIKRTKVGEYEVLA